MNPAAYDALRNHQDQADEDGVMVKVSRQALDEILADYDAMCAAATAYQAGLAAVAADFDRMWAEIDQATIARVRSREGEAMKPRTTIVKEGDTLWSIARDELGDADRWPEIFALNQREIITEQKHRDPALRGPDWIFPGTVLRLPNARGKIGKVKS